MVSNIDWLSAKAPSKLGYIRNCHMIESPQKVFIKRYRPLL